MAEEIAKKKKGRPPKEKVDTFAQQMSEAYQQEAVQEDQDQDAWCGFTPEDILIKMDLTKNNWPNSLRVIDFKTGVFVHVSTNRTTTHPNRAGVMLREALQMLRAKLDESDGK